MRERGGGEHDVRRCLSVALSAIFRYITRKSRPFQVCPAWIRVDSREGWRVGVRLLSGFARTIRCCANRVARGVNAEFTSAAVRNDPSGSWKGTLTGAHCATRMQMRQILDCVPEVNRSRSWMNLKISREAFFKKLAEYASTISTISTRCILGVWITTRICD